MSKACCWVICPVVLSTTATLRPRVKFAINAIWTPPELTEMLPVPVRLAEYTRTSICIVMLLVRSTGRWAWSFGCQLPTCGMGRTVNQWRRRAIVAANVSKFV